MRGSCSDWGNAGGGPRANLAGSTVASVGWSFSVHSIMVRVSGSWPTRWKRRFPAFFILFQSGSGSMAIRPSAMERQRRRATRRSCTGSALKPAATWSHSSSTRCIQWRRPLVFLARFAVLGGKACSPDRTTAEYHFRPRMAGSTRTGERKLLPPLRQSQELQDCPLPRCHGGTRLLDAGNHTGIGLVRLLGGRFIAPSCFIRGGPTRGGERLCVLAGPQNVYARYI